jgi:hypothetical protein
LDKFGSLKKAQGQDLAPDPLKRAFFSTQITFFFGPENFLLESQGGEKGFPLLL